MLTHGRLFHSEGLQWRSPITSFLYFFISIIVLWSERNIFIVKERKKETKQICLWEEETYRRKEIKERQNVLREIMAPAIGAIVWQRTGVFRGIETSYWWERTWNRVLSIALNKLFTFPVKESQSI